MRDLITTYHLVIHDLGNLEMQIIQSEPIKQDLLELKGRLDQILKGDFIADIVSTQDDAGGE